jgi:hypothetical protein
MGAKVAGVATPVTLRAVTGESTAVTDGLATTSDRLVEVPVRVVPPD